MLKQSRSIRYARSLDVQDQIKLANRARGPPSCTAVLLKCENAAGILPLAREHSRSRRWTRAPPVEVTFVSASLSLPTRRWRKCTSRRPNFLDTPDPRLHLP